MDKSVIFVTVGLFDRQIEVFSTKQAVAESLFISYKTLQRWLSAGNGKAVIKDHIVKECSINKCKKGFAAR